MQGSKPVVIAGAGISGLTLAQHLRAKGVAVSIHERDPDDQTRGIGWGLTLHWSVPALKKLLPAEIYNKLATITTDQKSYHSGISARFPFYDLSNGKLMAITPDVKETPRLRVTRKKLREVLQEGLDIKWNSGVQRYESHHDGVEVFYDDGTSEMAHLLIGCDGRSSRIRRQMFPESESYQIPICVMGAQVECGESEVSRLREMDPYFLQGTSSKDDTYMYFSILDCPENDDNTTGKYRCQAVVSWPYRPGFCGQESPLDVPVEQKERIELVKRFASTWAEPFKSFILGMPDDTEFIALNMLDFAPPVGLHTTGRVALMGDSIHTMTMYRGEGVNHAIQDVMDFAEIVTPVLEQFTASSMHHNIGAFKPSEANLRHALDHYENVMVARTRQGVLLARQACLDAHNFAKISLESPLLSKRILDTNPAYKNDINHSYKKSEAGLLSGSKPEHCSDEKDKHWNGANFGQLHESKYMPLGDTRPGLQVKNQHICMIIALLSVFVIVIYYF